MACDIHCYIEYRDDEDAPDHWWSFGHRINPGRNYCLFGRMAGVRGGSRIVAQRGIPDDIGSAAFDDWWMYIRHDTENVGEGECTWENAQRYNGYGSRFKGDYKPAIWTTFENGQPISTQVTGGAYDGRPTHVEHPDWHSPSWLTTAELSEVLKDGCPIEYTAMLGAMKAMEDRGAKARVVFWFDN